MRLSLPSVSAILESVSWWGIIWGAGYWLYGRFAVELLWAQPPSSLFSDEIVLTRQSPSLGAYPLLLGMPYYLVMAMAVWGAIRGAAWMWNQAAEAGACLGAVVWGVAGGLGYLLVLLTAPHLPPISGPGGGPEWPLLLVGMAGGGVAGLLAASVASAVKEMARDESRK
jgi:hypothetical protein